LRGFSFGRSQFREGPLEIAWVITLLDDHRAGDQGRISLFFCAQGRDRFAFVLLGFRGGAVASRGTPTAGFGAI
jgi:hypothetical protein